MTESIQITANIPAQLHAKIIEEKDARFCTIRQVVVDVLVAHYDKDKA